MGPGPPLLLNVDKVDNVEQTLLFLPSGNKPEMRITAVSVLRIDTGGERQFSNWLINPM